jgi:hypothetical protein
VLLRDAANRSAIAQWFNQLWKDAAPITRGDLDRAIDAYERVRAANRRRFGRKDRGRRGSTLSSFEALKRFAFYVGRRSRASLIRDMAGRVVRRTLARGHRVATPASLREVRRDH